MAYSPLPEGLEVIQLPPARYRIDYAALVRRLVPSFLRQPTQLAWLEVLTTPVQSLYGVLLSYRLQTIRELSYDSRVLMFEKALNDRFDRTARRIRIRNADSELEFTYDYFSDEDQPDEYTFMRNEHPPEPWQYDYEWTEFSTQTDFTVVAPVALQPRARQLHALIGRLKLANKNYTLLFQNQR
jgi:hypothetical protein